VVLHWWEELAVLRQSWTDYSEELTMHDGISLRVAP